MQLVRSAASWRPCSESWPVPASIRKCWPRPIHPSGANIDAELRRSCNRRAPSRSWRRSCREIHHLFVYSSCPLGAVADLSLGAGRLLRGERDPWEPAKRWSGVKQFDCIQELVLAGAGTFAPTTKPEQVSYRFLLEWSECWVRAKIQRNWGNQVEKGRFKQLESSWHGKRDDLKTS